MKKILVMERNMSSDKFIPLSLERLFNFISEYQTKGEIFGISKDLFFIPKNSDKFKMQRYGQLLDTPLGVAAGPHTQLSQNIISAYLTGARYMELKTIQVLDELEVTKPCIDISDEGYNCEWSQELKLHQSFDEYLNAWIMIHVLKNMLGFDQTEAGFIFNMSVGYNLEGIMSDTVQNFLNKMQNCSNELDKKIDEVKKFYPEIKNIKIPETITTNITISTMHGCPPEETFKIGKYFIEDRKLDTTIKLNPTLLGAKELREILNERLGFETQVPDLAFEHDLKYKDGINLIKSLTKSAEESNVVFNIKLTNTLETLNEKQKLPKNEKMVYMSGRALHPISINLAYKLQKEFNGKLDISFSAGADCFNITDILKCGLKPVTICSDILKPGGYGRIKQYVDNINEKFTKLDVLSIDDFIIKTAGKEDISEAILENLKNYSKSVLENPAYKKESYPYDSIKTKRKLEFFDCAKAPCMTECPAGQEVPRYINYVVEGDLEKAYKTVIATNPFPNVQGKVCDHQCQTKCTRINYDKPLLIRELKRYIAENFDEKDLSPSKSNGLKVCIIGAGPSGLSCAYYLALEGFEVEVYESKDFLGGMAADGIPEFRLENEALKKDIDRILSLGVKIHKNHKITKDEFDKLKKSFDFIYLAIGAQKPMKLQINGIESEGIYNQLDFLSKVRRKEKVELGKNVIIIGGGNSAMDAARTAKRIVGNDGEVTIVYRRTKLQMPCDIEEVIGALEENIKLFELASPKEIVAGDNSKKLICYKMELGEPDESGRRRPVKIDNSEFEIEFDSLIYAIGQEVVLDFVDNLKINNDYETNIPNIFVGGDALRGASNLINAIADGSKVAFKILEKAKLERKVDFSPLDDRKVDLKILQLKQATRDYGVKIPEKAPEDRLNFDLFIDTLSEEMAVKEATRCLQCDIFCNICTTVCPNRSNMYYEVQPSKIPLQKAVKYDDGKVQIVNTGTKLIDQPYQIINIGDFCNECGNCTTFCPSAGDPYKDKPKFHLTEESFDCANFGFYFAEENLMKIKTEDSISSLRQKNNIFEYEDNKIKVIFNNFSAETIEFKQSDLNEIKLEAITDYIFLFKNLKNKIH